MGTFRKWIAWLFNIRPEDLPEIARISPASENLDSKIQSEVSRQVREQLQQMLHEGVFREPQKPKTDQPISRYEPIEENELYTVGSSQAEEVQQQDNQQQPFQFDSSINLEEEFPEIEEFEPENPIEEINTSPTPKIPVLLIPEKTEALREEPRNEEEILPLEVQTQEILQQVEVPQLRPITDEEIRIGIDFGTTTTAISIKLGEERPEALAIGSDGITRYIPSSVYFQPGPGELSERVVVGEEAERFGDQAQVIRSVKRCFGCVGRNCRGNGNNENGPSAAFPWCRSDGLIHISETEEIEPKQVAHFILREALRRAIKVARDRWKIDLTRENISILPLNIGCGANFDLRQREIIQSIIRELGFSEVKIDNIVEEPILAGFTFSRFAEKPEGRVLIYDFGGGTFDVAVLDVDRFQDALRVTVVATAGENWLGGDDIDILVYNHFLNGIAAEVGSTTEVEAMLGTIDRSSLRSMARTAKEFLSSADRYSDVLPSQELGLMNLELHRDELENLLKTNGIIEKSISAVERACKLAYAFENAKQGHAIDAGVVSHHHINDAAKTIDRVILVGGITKIPCVRQNLEQIFGSEKIISETIIDPISAVAIGGAYPRDPQHYSICVPPFGFYLEYETPFSSAKSYQPIFYPYEYYEFHKFWSTGQAGFYYKDISLPENARNVKISSRKVGNKIPEEIKTVGQLSYRRWRFSASLDGIIRYYPEKGEPIILLDAPIIHPIQKDIRDERARRAVEAQNQIFEAQGDLDDWTRGMMNEN